MRHQSSAVRARSNPSTSQAPMIASWKSRMSNRSPKAKTALGDRFDIRDFHDAIIGAGALPLPILEQQVDRYIAARSNAG